MARDGPTGLGSPRGRVPFDSAGGQAQNAYQYVGWEFTGTGFSSIDQDIRVTRKANATTWAQTWSWTDSDTGGYIGLQTAGERFDGTKGDTAIFSLWDALARARTWMWEILRRRRRLELPLSIQDQ